MIIIVVSAVGHIAVLDFLNCSHAKISPENPIIMKMQAIISKGIKRSVSAGEKYHKPIDPANRAKAILGGR